MHALHERPPLRACYSGLFTYLWTSRRPATFLIESTFATVRLRTAKVRSCFSSKTVLTMAFQLCRCAQRKWQRLSGYEKLEKVVEGTKFINGIEKTRIAA
ncbi:MAG: hypothetical protein U9R02_11290 [Thermodesulfobacteriota bacterium]|nr:hypothetical protein [Thermodesulfobacteriota bacterium]